MNVPVPDIYGMTEAENNLWSLVELSTTLISNVEESGKSNVYSKRAT